jgi:hypothetical protein
MGYTQGARSPPVGLIVVVGHVGLISVVKAHTSIDGITRIGYISCLCEILTVALPRRRRVALPSIATRAASVG